MRSSTLKYSTIELSRYILRSAHVDRTDHPINSTHPECGPDVGRLWGDALCGIDASDDAGKSIQVRQLSSTLGATSAFPATTTDSAIGLLVERGGVGRGHELRGVGIAIGVASKRADWAVADIVCGGLWSIFGGDGMVARQRHGDG